MARLVVSAAVGIAVGYFSGNPQLGLQAATLTYGVSAGLDPNKKVLGAKLNDLKAPAASYGAPIYYIEGAPRYAGTFIWSSAKKEIANTETTDGKGGPGVDTTTFTYEIDVLIELAINRCKGIRRIWSNGKLVWSNADNADAQTLAASSATNSWRDLRFYDGGPAQLPDPTYEAAEGVGNAPAYRQRTTLMIEGLNLGNSGQLPVLTFEVVSEGEELASSVVYATAPAPLLGTARLPGVPAMTPDASFATIIGSSDMGVVIATDVYTIKAGGGAGIYTGHYLIAADSNVTGNGTTDESLIFIRNDSPFGARCVYEDGASCFMDFDGHAAGPISNGARIAKAGNILIFGHFGPGFALMRFDAHAGGTPSAFNDTHPSLANGVTSIALDVAGGLIYVWDTPETAVYVFDLTTLGYLYTIAPPSGHGTPFSSTVVTDADGTLYFLTQQMSLETLVDGWIFKWTGSAWIELFRNVGAVVGNSIPNAGPDCSYRVVGDSFLCASTDLSTRIQTIYLAAARLSITTPGLDQVVRRLCLRTGLLTDADIDVTALASQVVRAMPLSQVGPTRSALDLLMSVYLFEISETDVLRFVPRGGAAVRSIPYEDLGVSEQGDAEPLSKKLASDIETVARVSVKYANTLNDFQDGLEVADRLVTESTGESVTEVALGLTPTEAKRLADVSTMDQAMGRRQFGPLALSPAYSDLVVTDVVHATAADGSVYRLRLTRGTTGGGINAFEVALDDATNMVSDASTDSDYVSSTAIRVRADTEMVVGDWPIFRDVDDDLGPYVAVTASSPWPGAAIYKSSDDSTFAKIATITDKTVIGVAQSILADAPRGPDVFDTASSVLVTVGDGVLSSYTRDDAINGVAAVYMVGSECVIACDAAMQSSGPNVYRLSTFLRGVRGTEWAMAGHVSQERVVLVQVPGFRKVHDETADLNATRYYKAVTLGKTISAARSQAFVDTGVALKPFAPVNVEAHETGGGALLFTWDRRSRLATRLVGGGGSYVPLGEAVEAYDFELYDPSDILSLSTTVFAPQYSVSGLIADPANYVGNGFTSIWGHRIIGGERLAVFDDGFSGLSPSGHKGLVKLAADNSILDTSAGGASGIANEIIQFFNDGDSLYVVTQDYFNSVPATYKNSKVQKMTRGTLGTIDASASSTVPGDWVGGCHDGTDVWVSELQSGNLRRLDATTLASIASYAFAGGPGAMSFDAGKIYVCCSVSDELVCMDAATHTEDWRVATSAYPVDVLVEGSLVFVLGGSSISVHDLTGAVVATHAHTVTNYLPQREMTVFGSDVAISVLAAPGSGATSGPILMLDTTTGLETNLLASPTFNLYFVAGVYLGDLLLAVSDGPGQSVNTRYFKVAPPLLAGYTAKVYQKSAQVGRGYPAILEL